MNIRNWIGRRVGITLMTLAAVLSSSKADAQQPGAATARVPLPATVSLADLNASSRAEYARARAAALARLGPIIEVYEGEKVVLVRGTTRTEERFDPAESPNLKAVAHVPLAVWAALDLSNGQPIVEGRIDELRTFRNQIAAARSSISAGMFPPSTLERQYRMLDSSLALLDASIANGSVSSSDIGSFARHMAPLTLANVREAARGQVDLLHAVVSRWRAASTPEDWARVHVVIMGVHMARDGELAQQYFVRLLGESGEGRRVVYAEGLFDESKALEMLGTHLIDGRAGTAFFGHDLRMHRDILADAARERLDELGVGP